MLNKFSSTILWVLWLSATPAWAEESQTTPSDTPEAAAATPPAASAPAAGASAPTAPPATPTVRHAPPAIADMSEDFAVHVSLMHPELVRTAVLTYRVDGAKAKEVSFQRSSADDYVAVVPVTELDGERLGYWITLQLVDGAKVTAYASENDPHQVQIVPTATDLNERALLSRVDGRRNAFTAMGEYVDFGHSQTTNNTSNGTTPTTVHDWYYRLEAGYTYRPLRLVSEFSLRIGIVRGESPVPADSTGSSSSSSGDPYHVGLNYAAPTVRFRLSDIVYADGTLLSSVTQAGYSTGAGGALLIGDPYGTNLTAGFEVIQVFGARFYARTDIAVHPKVRLTPIIEVTNMPHADTYGVRLLGEATARVAPGVRVGLRGGYQARKFDSGGASFGALFAYEL